MTKEKGFTLIELSIVLVIIGLIVGGILVGQDLIKAAEVRAQISQIEKYNSAVNTFRGKFGGLPGDLALAPARQYGFAVAGNCNGSLAARDGNGLIDGAFDPWELDQTIGETGYFWNDLSNPIAGSLIEGTFPNSGATLNGCSFAGLPGLNLTPGTTYVGDYLPEAKMGHGNFVYIMDYSGYNWYAVSDVTSINSGGGLRSTSSLPVIQAYQMDKKVDDGLPLSGSVQTIFDDNTLIVRPFSAPTDSLTTCYNTANNAYSISSLSNYGANGNCALSFRFQ